MWVRGKMDIWAASFVEGMDGLGGIVYTAYCVDCQLPNKAPRRLL